MRFQLHALADHNLCNQRYNRAPNTPWRSTRSNDPERHCDPWLLLVLPQLTSGIVDWLARQLLYSPLWKDAGKRVDYQAIPNATPA